MVQSKYNWIVNNHGRTIIYNWFTGAIVELDKLHNYISEYLLHDDMNSLMKTLTSDQVNFFRSAGFLIDKDFDERFHLSVPSPGR